MADLGSGAGLPGVALAIARPDLSVTLIDASARRCDFLIRALGALQRSDVAVVRGRVDGTGATVVTADGRRRAIGPFGVVTARAVAPLGRLLPWLACLARPAGVLLAIRGAAAAQELSEAAPQVRAISGRARLVAVGPPEAPTLRVVRIDLPGADR